MIRKLLAIVLLGGFTACSSQPIELDQILALTTPEKWKIDDSYERLAEYHQLRFQPIWMVSNAKLNSVISIDDDEGKAQIALGVYGGLMDLNAHWTMCVIELETIDSNVTSISAYDGKTSSRCEEFFQPLRDHPKAR